MNKIILSRSAGFLTGFTRLETKHQPRRNYQFLAGRVRKIFSNRAGFTLVELLVSVIILSIVLAGVYALFSSGRIFWFSQGAAINVQDEARKALDHMAMELTQAVDIDSNPSTRATIDPLRTISVNSMAFKIPVFCDANGIWLDIDNDGTDDYYIETVVGSGGIDVGAYIPNDFAIDPATSKIRLGSQDNSRRNRRIVYSLGGLNNSQLIRSVESSAGLQLDTRVLANNVTGLRFRRRNTFTAPAPERRIIIIEVDILKNIFPGRTAVGDPVNTMSLSTRATLRN